MIEHFSAEDVTPEFYAGPEGQNALHATVVTALQNIGNQLKNIMIFGLGRKFLVGIG